MPSYSGHWRSLKLRREDAGAGDLAVPYCGPIDQTEIDRGCRQSTAPFPK